VAAAVLAAFVLALAMGPIPTFRSDPPAPSIIPGSGPVSGFVFRSTLPPPPAISVAPTIAENFSVVFEESGLSIDRIWGVDFNGLAVQTGEPNLSFRGLVNGTYTYQVEAPKESVSSPSSGTVVVQGHNTSVALNFTNLPPINGPPTNLWLEILGVGVIAIFALAVIMAVLIVRRRRKEAEIDQT
jgi:hypothetical protein